MDPEDADEETWCSERRDDLVQYLRGQGLAHAGVGEVPAWFSAPYVSIWAIESLKVPGSVGWWAISGDLPSDYCSAQGCHHPRLAMKRIAEEWRSAIEQTRSDSATIGETGLPVSLLPLLKARADLLLKLSADDELWTD